MEEALAEHGAREATSVRTKISYLNTIATIAPMLGLLGTVSGMIKAFGNIATMGMGNASVLADNISEALITTAGGLVIAIPAMALFFFFRNRLNELMVYVEDQIGDFIDTLENQE
jgi:biopolymer transport protein ExbB